MRVYGPGRQDGARGTARARGMVWARGMAQVRGMAMAWVRWCREGEGVSEGDSVGKGDGVGEGDSMSEGDGTGDGAWVMGMVLQDGSCGHQRTRTRTHVQCHKTSLPWTSRIFTETHIPVVIFSLALLFPFSSVFYEETEVSHLFPLTYYSIYN